MRRGNKLPANPHDWNDRDVRTWLKQKGFGHSIQNKFFGERIDGEALLLLTHKDIEAIVQMFPNTDKAKIKFHVDTLIARTKGEKVLPVFKNYETRKRKRGNTDDQIAAKRRKMKHNNSIIPSPIGGSKNKKIAKCSINSNNALRALSNQEIINDEDDMKLHSDTSQSSKNKNYCYSQINTHDISNHGQRWSKNELELMWKLHQKGRSLKTLAEHFKRTECGIHVQIYYREKAMKERQEVRKERKRTKKWIKQLKGDYDSEETSSDEDVPIMHKILRNPTSHIAPSLASGGDIARLKENYNNKISPPTTNNRAVSASTIIPSPSPYIFSPDKNSELPPQREHKSVEELEYEEMIKDMI